MLLARSVVLVLVCIALPETSTGDVGITPYSLDSSAEIGDRITATNGHVPDRSLGENPDDVLPMSRGNDEYSKSKETDQTDEPRNEGSETRNITAPRFNLTKLAGYNVSDMSDPVKAHSYAKKQLRKANQDLAKALRKQKEVYAQHNTSTAAGSGLMQHVFLGEVVSLGKGDSQQDMKENQAKHTKASKKVAELSSKVGLKVRKAASRHAVQRSYNQYMEKERAYKRKHRFPAVNTHEQAVKRVYEIMHKNKEAKAVNGAEVQLMEEVGGLHNAKPASSAGLSRDYRSYKTHEQAFKKFAHRHASIMTSHGASTGTRHKESKRDRAKRTDSRDKITAVEPKLGRYEGLTALADRTVKSIRKSLTKHRKKKRKLLQSRNKAEAEQIIQMAVQKEQQQKQQVQKRNKQLQKQVGPVNKSNDKLQKKVDPLKMPGNAELQVGTRPLVQNTKNLQHTINRLQSHIIRLHKASQEATSDPKKGNKVVKALRNKMREEIKTLSRDASRSQVAEKTSKLTVKPGMFDKALNTKKRIIHNKSRKEVSHEKTTEEVSVRALQQASTLLSKLQIGQEWMPKANKLLHKSIAGIKKKAPSFGKHGEESKLVASQKPGESEELEDKSVFSAHELVHLTKGLKSNPQKQSTKKLKKTSKSLRDTTLKHIHTAKVALKKSDPKKAVLQQAEFCASRKTQLEYLQKTTEAKCLSPTHASAFCKLMEAKILKLKTQRKDGGCQ